MHRFFRRAGYLVVAVLLGLAGMVVMAGSASAAEQPNGLDDDLTSNTFLRPCASPCGVQDTIGLLPGNEIRTYCKQGQYNLAYSNPSTGRGGFVLNLRLDFPNLQQQACGEAGAFASVNQSSTLRSCSSNNCVNFGGVSAGDQAGAFCRLGSTFYLVFVDEADVGAPRAGFLHEDVLSSPLLPLLPGCNDSFNAPVI